MDHEIPQHVESKMNYHIAHSGTLQDHSILRIFAKYTDRARTPVVPGVLMNPRMFADIIYIDSGIGKARIGKDMVDVMDGTVILIKPGTAYKLISGSQELTARRYSMH